MTGTLNALLGCFLEPYAIVDGERRHIPKTTDDVYIDAQTGAVDFSIVVTRDTDGLYGAFLADEIGELTGQESYDGFELEFYDHCDEDAEPIARYHADHPDVEADICIPIVEDLAQARVTLTPRGSCGFEDLASDNSETEG